MPRLGLGVYKIPPGESTEQAVSWALEAGYRHIDTAKLYQNEESVGKAIRASGLKREEVFVTTKLWVTDQLAPARSFETSLKKIGLDYIDLYLIHYPVPGLVKRTWKAMEEIYAAGKTRAIGISNFNASQMNEVLSIGKIPPAVNQLRCSPFFYDKDAYNLCQSQNIAFEAYSPLTQGQHLDNNFIREIADHYKKSPAQILIRWALQKNMVVIPKSAHQNHIQENADVYDFEISQADMVILDGLST